MLDISNLPVYARMFADLEDIAKQIEYACVDILIAPPKGIYAINKIEPVMVDGGHYFTLEKGIKIPVSNITDLKCKVYTEVNDNRVEVVPARFMMDKKKYLSSEPILPYRGMLIVKAMIEQQIYKFLSYSIQTINENEVYTHFIGSNNLSDDYICIVDPYICKINEIYEPLYYSIKDFLSNYDWNLYFITFSETRLKIERSLDYRAYQWLTLKEQEAFDLEHAND